MAYLDKIGMERERLRSRSLFFTAVSGYPGTPYDYRLRFLSRYLKHSGKRNTI